MIKGFLNGIDSGLMNLLLFTENDPIKYKRLIPIYQFIDDILNDIFEYLTNNFEGVDENDEFDEKKFAELTPYCNFFIANIKKDPFELINEEENEGGKFFQSLSRFIIISSYTHDAKLKNWAHVNRIRFNGCKYLPPM
ncbi:hypothetical protein GPJ56_009554 [Histomonas meleagridis]|nr:hypothetical protein GPJ56_009554 [Histomonas meleagridis]